MKIKYVLIMFFIPLTLLLGFKFYGNLQGKELYQTCQTKKHICGDINIKMEKQVLKALRLSPNKIFITSGGGEHVIAMRIADMLNEMNVTLVIDGPCFSACAQNLVLAVQNVELTDQSIIAFHHSGSYMYSIAKIFFQNNNAYLSHTQKISVLENNFFEKYGLDKNALYVPGEKISYNCIGRKIIVNPNDMLLYQEKKFSWYVPSLSVLEKWRGGKPLIGHPVTKEDFVTRMAKYPIILSSNSFVFDTVSTVSDLDANIRKIKFCKNEPKGRLW